MPLPKKIPGPAADFNPSFSLFSSDSLLLRGNNTTTPSKSKSISFNLSSFTPHIHVFQPFIHHYNSSPFTVLASSSSSSVAVGTENDPLPAELKVTETEEPNSRVRLHVELPSLVCEHCYNKVIAEFMKQAKIPGKKVPESILVGYVGVKNVKKATFTCYMTSSQLITVKDADSYIFAMSYYRNNFRCRYNFDTEDGDKVLPVVSLIL